MNYLIILIVIVGIIILVKEWLKFRTVAVSSPDYGKRKAVHYLLFAFLTFTAISSVFADALFELLNLKKPHSFEVYSLVAFGLLCLATVLIFRSTPKNNQNDGKGMTMTGSNFLGNFKIFNLFGEQKINITQNEKKKITPELLQESLKQQLDNQLKKQIHSGKYIPKTFIETRKEKDHIRYFAYPFLFYKKAIQEIELLDFRYLNSILKARNLPEYEFYIPTELKSEVDFENIYDKVEALCSYLSNKKEEIEMLEVPSYKKESFKYKIERRIKELRYLESKAIIITENAGQGKTNCICDFVENFIIRRDIPCAFLTGYELSSSDLQSSFLQNILLKKDDTTMSDFIEAIEAICSNSKSHFILIIDGINENLNPNQFSKNLESFISQIINSKYVRVILTSRIEYFENNFTNLKEASFSSDIAYISSLNGRLEDDEKEKLLKTYLHYFNVKVRGISKEAKKLLVDNFLLLRIFAETYANQDVGYLGNIYKEELFRNYYELKSKEINARIKDNDEFNVSGNFDIRNFLKRITEKMIASNQFVNIPLDDLIEDKSLRSIYVRFLDENMLVRRNLKSKEGGIFGMSEVVNFTFDEFRDYTISDYLVNTIYPESKETFVSFLEKNLSERSLILEGCSSFLFFISKKRNNPELTEILENQDWHNNTFSKCIFQLKDENIIDKDVQYLRDVFLSDRHLAGRIARKFIYRRWDNQEFPNLNIDFLYDVFRNSEEPVMDYYYKTLFSLGSFGDYYKVNLASVMEQMEDFLNDADNEQDFRFHKLFELFIFLMPYNGKAAYLFERYCYKFPELGREMLSRNEATKNAKLKKSINQFCSRYEIAI